MAFFVPVQIYHIQSVFLTSPDLDGHVCGGKRKNRVKTRGIYLKCIDILFILWRSASSKCRNNFKRATVIKVLHSFQTQFSLAENTSNQTVIQTGAFSLQTFLSPTIILFYVGHRCSATANNMKICEFLFQRCITKKMWLTLMTQERDRTCISQQKRQR